MAWDYVYTLIQIHKKIHISKDGTDELVCFDFNKDTSTVLTIEERQSLASTILEGVYLLSNYQLSFYWCIIGILNARQSCLSQEHPHLGGGVGLSSPIEDFFHTQET